jgi:2,4-dienoyl-CoA reductase-like NADH-dependent reductase (Old Yellow Enzyme family)
VKQYPRVASLTTAQAFASHLASEGIGLGFDAELLAPAASPLARPLEVDGVRIGNRFCVLPMEGWDGTRDGAPSELTLRRWRNFGSGGAKLIWGGEAVAVRQDGRANPNQLLISEKNQKALAGLRETLVAAHRERFGSNADADLHVGLQLTHSGRFSCPSSKDQPEPLVAYEHPLLDRRFARGVQVMSDDDMDLLVEDFIRAARLAQGAGFAFVDVKHCHGYLAHELLSAVDRPGRYGGSFQGRTRFLRSVVEGIRSAVPGLGIGVRVSIIDSVPYGKDAEGRGVPLAEAGGYRHAFGLARGGDLSEALPDGTEFLRLLEALRIHLVCLTAGSPYYCPHVQRPALFPPVDGYGPPEDPLAGVARQIEVTARLKRAFPELVFVGSAYSYLQEWLPHVAQHCVGRGLVDLVGLGRIALSYPELPADVLSGRPLQRKLLCRTFSDCTNGPRMGLVSGCFPLDPYYAGHPDAERLKQGKARLKEAQAVAKA